MFMQQVGILVLDQVFDSAFALTHDVLRMGAHMAKTNSGFLPFTLQILCVDKKGVTTGSGQQILADRTIEESSSTDIIVIPGLELLDEQSMSACLAHQRTRAAIKWLSQQYERGSTLAASCTSTFVLAETGLLDHRLATTSWWLAKSFREKYPNVRLQLETMVTQEDSLICGGAAMAHMDLALALLDRLSGPNLSDAVAKFLLLDGRDSQARFGVSHFLARSNDETRMAEIWIRQHLETPLTVAQIASGVGVTPRTLSRRIIESTGKSCNKFIQRIRVERAVQLLQTTNLNFELISNKVGYAHPATLRKLILRRTGKVPSALRSLNPLIKITNSMQ